MPASKVMLSQVFWVRLAALLFTCVAFSVAAHSANVHGGLADCCIFCWAFSFTCTLLVLLVEQFGLQARIPVSWSNFSITVACYAALLCLFASFIFVMSFVIDQWYANERSFRITSTVFSCLAMVAYMYEVILIKASARQRYMATVTGLLKVGQTIVACIIFILISNPVSYSHHEALEWCMAVYCICFIVSMVVVILFVGRWRKSVPFSQFLSAYGLLAFLMYLSAVIIWPIFTFGEKYRRGGDMSTQIYVTALTAINMLLYLADLVYTARQVFITRRPGAPPPRVPAARWKTPQLTPVERPYHDPANDPANDPVNDPANDPAHDPAHDPANDPAHDPAHDPVNDPANDPTNDPTNDPANDPANDPPNDPTNDPPNDPTNDPANDCQVTTQIINMPTVH